MSSECSRANPRAAGGRWGRQQDCSRQTRREAGTQSLRSREPRDSSAASLSSNGFKDESHDGRSSMIRRTRATFLAALSALSLGALAAPAANANVLSLLPGMCAGQSESQPFAQFGDQSNYTLVPGGNFEGSGTPWSLSGGARIVAGNESNNVGGAGDSASLSLPAGSSATSPSLCT